MSAGLLASVQNLLASLLGLARTRLDLLSTELQEALAHFALGIILAVAAAFAGDVGLRFSNRRSRRPRRTRGSTTVWAADFYRLVARLAVDDVHLRVLEGRHRDSVEEAQRNKIEHVCRKIRLVARRDAWWISAADSAASCFTPWSTTVRPSPA